MAPTIKVNPQTYYNAAKNISLIAEQAVLPFGALHNALHDNAGMAGNYTGLDTWTTPYDSQAEDFHQAFIAYANALQHFGDVLDATGYNWDISNYNADTNPNKGPAPDKPTPASDLLIKSGLATPPSAKSGDTRPGLDEGLLHGLLAKITHPIPNGDTGKLASVHTAWDAFAKHDAVTNAADAIKQILNSFSDHGTVDPHLSTIQDNLTTLSTAAGNLVEASTAIAASVGTHHDQLAALRSTISSDRTNALAAIGATAVAFAVLWCVTVIATDGVGAAATGEEAGAAGAATEAEIATAGAAISTDIATSPLPALLADGSEIFGAIARFTKTDTQLLAIQALIVATVGGDSEPENLKYQKSDKHGAVQRGDAAPEPTNGQETLDRSVPIKPTTSRRVGYDPETGEFDVFDETHNGTGIYHGHQRSWDELTQDMQNALVKSGVVNRRGKPL